MTFHRQSTSAMYPRHSGLAAVKANYDKAKSGQRCANRRVAIETHAYHYGSKRDERIIHAPRLFDITTLERQLKTAATHAETHRIHVDVIDKGSAMPRF
jgi:hypothetical protein